MSNAKANVSGVSPVDQAENYEEGGSESEAFEKENEVVDDASVAVEPDLPLGVIFEVLKNERRRRVIRYLQEAEGEVTLGEVSEHIAALENDKEVKQITYAERKRVYVGLYQCHLPKMDDMGIVDFNRSRGLIELTENAACLTPYMEDRTPEAPWYQYYGALAGAGLAISLASALEPVAVPTVLLLSVVVGGFAVLSCVHAYSEEPDVIRGVVPAVAK